jgi:hypothetical protein
MRRLLFEDPPRFFAVEKFETALGVVQPEAEQQTDHEIESDSTELAQVRLMFLDIFPIDGP